MKLEDIEDNTSGVYSIVCLQNGKQYIGSSKNIKHRWKQHIYHLDLNCHHSSKLQEDWRKYGSDAFEFNVLAKANIAEARKLEVEYIDKLKVKKFGYNVESLKENIKLRFNQKCEDILDYISDTYIPDGNVYCYDIYEMSKALRMFPTELLKFINFDTKPHSSLLLSDGQTALMFNWTNAEIFVEVVNAQKYNPDTSETIEVDVDIWSSL